MKTKQAETDFALAAAITEMVKWEQFEQVRILTHHGSIELKPVEWWLSEGVLTISIEDHEQYTNSK